VSVTTCDYCGVKIDDWEGDQSIEVSIDSQDDRYRYPDPEPSAWEFCSWLCLAGWVLTRGLRRVPEPVPPEDPPGT
jgi:hypothetical protein